MNDLRFIRQNIYTLKRQYSTRITIYTQNSVTTDLATGVRTVDKSAYTVERAIVLPKTLERQVVQLLTHYRAAPDVSRRSIIIDKQDFPANYVYKESDYVIVADKRYDLLKVVDFESNLAVILEVKEYVGELPRAILNVSATSEIEINSGGNNG